MARLAAVLLGVVCIGCLGGRPLVIGEPDASGRAGAGAATAGSAGTGDSGTAGTSGDGGAMAGTGGGAGSGTAGVGGGPTGGTAGSIGPMGGSMFLPAVNYATGFNATAVAIGDLDGNGATDIAVACYGSNDSNNGGVSVLLNSGGGRFAASIFYPVFGMPRGLALGDVTGDGWADLIVSDPSRAAITLLRNDGKGRFAATMSFGTDRYPSDVAIGDFNGDGRPDVATANEQGTVSILLAMVGPGLGPRVDYPAGGFGTRSLTVTDLNGDGWPDIAVANGGTPSEAGNASVLLNRGDGTFAAPVAYALSDRYTMASGIAAGDLDGDGRPDLAVLTYAGSGVIIFRNLGDGTFTLSNAPRAGSQPIALAIGDLDGNGQTDIAFADYAMTGNGSASVLLGAGPGRLAGPFTFGAGPSPMDVALADLDGDRRTDIAIANQVGGSVSVLLALPR
jgi:hypothetical protein